MGIPYRAGDAAPRARKSFDCPAENRLENQRRKWGSRAFGSEAHHADLQNRKDGSEAACLSHSNSSLISTRVKLRSRARRRPRESRCLTIWLAGQNNCGTIGLSSLAKTPTERGRRRARGRGSKLRSLG